MEQRQREIFEEFKRDIAQRNREFDRDIKELERAVGRQFTEALAYANGDIPLKQFMDTACEISEISDYLLDKRMISVDRLPPSDLKEIFPLISLTNAKTPWTEEVVTVPISSKLETYMFFPILDSRFEQFFKCLLEAMDQKFLLDFRIVRDQELRYTSIAGRTIYGSPAYTVVSGAANHQVQHLVVIEDREMELEMQVKEARVLAFMSMAREKQDLDENYPMYGLVIDSDSFHFYRLDTLKGEWSRKCSSFSIQDYHLQNIADLLASIMVDASQRKSAYENVAPGKLEYESRLAKSPSADDKQYAGNGDGDAYLVWSDDEAPTGPKDAVKEARFSTTFKEPSVGATVPVGRRHKRLKSFHISNVQHKTAEDDLDNSSTTKDNSSSSDTQESEETQSVSDHDSCISDYKFGDWEMLQRPASAGQV